MKDKIREILGKKLDGTEKQFVETTNELLKLLGLHFVSNKEERVAVCNCPGTKITNPAIIYVCSKCDKPIDFEWQLETDC